MPKKTEPLSYAIIKLFGDGEARCAADVVRELRPAYCGHKQLTERSVDEALATANENGLLDKSDAIIDDGELHIFFMLNDYGREMVEKYL